MNFEPGWGRWERFPAALSRGGTSPWHSLACPRDPEVELSSSRSPVFDRQIRRSIGTDHGFEKFDSGRAELVVSRITTTISIARQGPSAFFISAGGPALRRKSLRPVPIFPRQLLQPEAHCKKQWLAGCRDELE
jgi:hypothetical protein